LKHLALRIILQGKETGASIAFENNKDTSATSLLLVAIE